MLTTVFLMQNSRFIASAAGLYVDAFRHDRWAGLCGLNPTESVCCRRIVAIGAYIGDISHTDSMSEVRNLPGRATTPGKKTSPWKERIVLVGCIIGAWEISERVISVMDPHLGWWANPFAVIVLGLASLILANQLIIFIEKLQGIQ